MNVISLCAGIAGLDAGLRLAVPEARTVCLVEIDGYCQRVLASRMLDGSIDCCPIYGDLLKFDGRPWRGCVDLVIGGWPCQDISNAGRREGIREGNRSGLWFEVVRILREVRPRYFFGENVSALLGRGMDTVLGNLSDLGFDAEWTIVSAADVGAPHLRKRLFLLAHAQHTQRGQEALGGGHAGEGQDGEGEAAGGPGERGDALADGRGQRLEGNGETGSAAGTTGRGGGAEVADSQEQRRELRAAQGERPGRPAGGGEPVGHAEDGDVLDVRGERRDAEGQGQGWAGYAATAGEPVGNAQRAGLQGSARIGLPGTGRAAGFAAGADHEFPPGPADRAGWGRYLARFPEAQPCVRGGAVRPAHRVDRLRALGNCVVPQQAALAFSILWERVQNGE